VHDLLVGEAGILIDGGRLLRPCREHYGGREQHDCIFHL
jgi:hypothetical protein